MGDRLKAIAAAAAHDRAHPQRRRKIDSARALVLYYCGASDPEIGRAFGVVGRVATSWRHRRQLPANRCVGGHAGVRRLCRETKAEALRLLQSGETMSSAAARLGVKRQALRWHRDRAADQALRP
jgi:hypothetical protein